MSGAIPKYGRQASALACCGVMAFTLVACVSDLDSLREDLRLVAADAGDVRSVAGVAVIEGRIVLLDAKHESFRTFRVGQTWSGWRWSVELGDCRAYTTLGLMDVDMGRWHPDALGGAVWVGSISVPDADGHAAKIWLTPRLGSQAWIVVRDGEIVESWRGIRGPSEADEEKKLRILRLMATPVRDLSEGVAEPDARVGDIVNDVVTGRINNGVAIDRLCSLGREGLPGILAAMIGELESPSEWRPDQQFAVIDGYHVFVGSSYDVLLHAALLLRGAFNGRRAWSDAARVADVRALAVWLQVRRHHPESPGAAAW